MYIEGWLEYILTVRRFVMHTNVLTKKSWFATALTTVTTAVSLVACSEGGEPCDGIDDTEHMFLPTSIKNFGDFKIGTKFHYKHSDGYQFDMTVISDTIATTNVIKGMCRAGTAEVREIRMKSDYPISYAEINLLADGKVNITFDRGYYLGYLPTDSSDYIASVMADSVEINDIVYKGVYLFGYDEEFDTIPDLYLSPTKGILKVNFENGEVSLMEKSDDVSKEDDHE